MFLCSVHLYWEFGSAAEQQVNELRLDPAPQVREQCPFLCCQHGGRSGVQLKEWKCLLCQ